MSWFLSEVGNSGCSNGQMVLALLFGLYLVTVKALELAHERRRK